MIDCNYAAFMRHADAYNNQAERQHQEGVHGAYDDVVRLPSSMHDLTPEGVKQAIQAREWLRRRGFKFRRHVVSEHVRAIRTAYLLNISDALWELDPRLGEKDTGILNELTPEGVKEYFASRGNNRHELDPFRFRADRGESYLDLRVRVEPVFASLTTDTLVVCHGHIMRVLDHVMRGESAWTFNPKVEIPNCALIEYRRGDRGCWTRRMSVPSKDTFGNWEVLSRRTYSTAGLGELIDHVLELKTRTAP